MRRLVPLVGLLLAALVAATGADVRSNGLPETPLAPGLHAIGTRPLSWVEASGVEVLALDAERHAELWRWIARGGSLSLSGDAAEVAARSLLDAVPGPEDRALGLGEVVVAVAGHRAAGREPAGTAEWSRAAAALAASSLPDRAGLRRASAGRLLTYAALLSFALVDLRVRRRARPAWGVLVLAAVVALAPWWERLAPWGADRAVQIDVAVATADAPTLLWSGAALRSARRGTLRLAPEEGRALRIEKMSGHAAPVDLGSDGRLADAARQFAVAARRGTEVSVSWDAEDPVPQVLVAVTHREGRLTGLVRNEADHGWQDVWLALPGREPLRLGDLPASDATVVAEEAPPALDRTTGRGVPSDDLPLGRQRLLEAVWAGAVETLLDRGLPVLVAWSDQPLVPARTNRGGTIREGFTLLVCAARIEA